MKKLLLLCCLLVIGAGLSHATETTYTSTKGSISTSAKTFKTGANDNSDALDWTYSSTNASMPNPEYNGTDRKECYRFGTKNNTVGTLTLTTSSLSSKTITSVIFNGWGNADATSYDVAIKVGDTEFTPTGAKNISGTTVKNLEFTGNASGDIVITCTNKSKAGVNFCGVTVTYTDGSGSDVDPDPVAVEYNASFKDQTYPIVEGNSLKLDLGTSHPVLTFTPADSEIASISTDGLISAKKVGSQEFTATWSGSDDWVAGSAKFTVNVTEKPAPGSYTWSLLTDASLLKAGMQVIIVCTEKGDAISNASKDNNRPVTSVTFADTEKTGINTLSNDVLTLKVGGETGKWTFLTTNYTGTNGNGYLGNTSTGKKNNYCQVRSSLETGCYASVSVDASNNSVIKFDAPNSRGILSRNTTSDLYGCYNAEQSPNQIPIQIFYNTKSVDPDAVAKPTISFADNKVTITSAEGTTVRYTTDGTTTPTATVGTEYKDPFTITASCTVKAVAIKDGKTSDVASLDVTYVEPTKPYANFAEMIAAGDKDGITVNGPITVVYAYMKYLYTYDKDNNGMLLYGTTTTSDQVNGKAYASVTGNYVTTRYVEIADYTLGAEVEGSAIAPEIVTPGDVTKEMQYKYVKLKGVKYDGTNLTADGKSIAQYNKFSLSSYLASGKYYDVVGIVDIYNDNLQVLVISFTEVAGPGQVAMPVIAPDGGEVFVDTPITLTCATAGAKIYYTTNSTTPTTASTLYDAATPITLGTAGSATVKAIAVKDGMEASEVATATFTVKDYATPTGLKVLYHGEEVKTNDEVEVPVNNVFSFSCTDATKIVINDIAGETLLAEVEGPDFKYTFTDDAIVTVYGANDKHNSTEEITFGVTVLKWLKEELGSTEATYSVLVPELTFNEDHVYINTYPGAVLYIKKDTKAASAPMRVPYTSTWTSAESHEEMIGNDEPGKYLVKAVSDHDKFPKGMESEVVGFTIDNEGTVTGIEDVEAGAEEGEVEYFNLQGVRVMNPTKGIYIRKYGSNATKVCL